MLMVRSPSAPLALFLAMFTASCAPELPREDDAGGASADAIRGGTSTQERNRSFALATYGMVGCSGTFVSNRALLVDGECASRGHFGDASVWRPGGLERATVAEMRAVAGTGLALLFMREDLRDVTPVRVGSTPPDEGERVTLFALGADEDLDQPFPYGQLSPPGSGAVQHAPLVWGEPSDHASNWGDWGGVILDDAGAIRAVLVSRKSTWLGLGGTRDVFLEMAPFVRAAIDAESARPPR